MCEREQEEKMRESMYGSSMGNAGLNEVGLIELEDLS